VYLLVQHVAKEVPCTSLDWQKEMLERLQLSKDDEEQRRLSTASGGLVPMAPNADNNPASVGLSIEDLEDDHKEDDQDNSEDDVAMLDSIHGYLGDADADASAWASAAARTLLSPNTPRHDSLSNRYCRVVHVNGIHHIALVTCACHGSEAVHADLMYCRLVPATFSRYRTLFTVAVLDDFRISNLECKASAYQYFQKLRRLTCPMAPARAPNLYQELLRMARVWRWLKKKKWAGHGHATDDFTKAAPGELANFCPACPQPGINLPQNWKDDPNRCV
jgi:CxC2 like cysteine cluster associated with KDZ transposases